MRSRLTRLTQLRRDTDGVTSVQLVTVLIIGSYNVSLCPSSVPSTSEYFLLTSSLNVSVLTSWLPGLTCGDCPKLQRSFGFGSSSLSVVPVAVTVSGDCHVSRSDGKGCLT